MSSSDNPLENSANVTCVDHVKQCEPQKPPSRRSSISAVQWDRCIYCQCESKAKVHEILTLETSDRILNRAKLDCILRYRLAGISDLVAAEAKYHLQCHASFMQNLNKTQAAIGADNLSSYNQACFIAVVQELEKGLDGGNIYTVKSVWDRYCELMTTTTSINTSALSSSSDSNALRAFRKKLESSLGDKVEFITNTSKKESLLIVPSVTKDSIFQTLKDTAVDKDTKDTECALQTFSLIGERDNILKSIYYVSSKVKMDIKNGVGHTTYSGIDKDHTEEVVPQSLFLLLSMILGENEECDNHDRILNIAQDIVYAQSKGRKLTPKHIGLGVTLHHLTRSKQVIQLIHEAGHCISYEGVQRVDTSIAKSELSRYMANGNMLVPSNLVENQFVQFAADNIDIIEDVLDGKGTFHATQCAAFQHGGNRDSVTDTCKTTGKERSLGTLLPNDFHEVMDSGYCAKRRPAPIF